MHYEDEAVLLQDLQNRSAVLFQDLQNLQFQQPQLSEKEKYDDNNNNSNNNNNNNSNNNNNNSNNSKAVVDEMEIKTSLAIDPHHTCNSNSSRSRSAASAAVGRKSCKKDRHSKINTAHGPRDRRMRLSLEVARKFFDLQDLLGFDKASKTVEWLLTKSRYAILELSEGGGGGLALGGSHSASSTSECEVISGVIDEPILNNETTTPQGQSSSTNKVKPSKEKKKAKAKAARRVPYHPLAKQCREKARERARERTKEKKRRVLLVDGEETKLRINEEIITDVEMNRLRSSWGSSSVAEDGAKSINNKHVEEEEEDQLISTSHRQLPGIAENLSTDWSPSALFNTSTFHLNNNGAICTAPQFMDLHHQFYYRSSSSSEAYSYSNMNNLCG